MKSTVKYRSTSLMSSVCRNVGEEGDAFLGLGWFREVVGVGPHTGTHAGPFCSRQSVSVAPGRREHLDCGNYPAERAVLMPTRPGKEDVM